MYFLLFCLFALVYFLPAFIAAQRHHHNGGAIFMLNLLAGWTVIGWIIAMVWASTQVRRMDAQ
jgi:hypothetical protein